MLLFLADQSFLVRKRLQSYIKSYLSYSSLRIAFQSKTRFFILFRFKEILFKKLVLNFVLKLACSCYNTTYYGDSERHFFARASEHLGITSITGK